MKRLIPELEKISINSSWNWLRDKKPDCRTSILVDFGLSYDIKTMIFKIYLIMIGDNKVDFNIGDNHY